MEWLVPILAGCTGLLAAGITGYAKVLSIQTAHNLELERVKNARDTATHDRDKSDRQDEVAREDAAYQELKILLQERKAEMEKQSARLDKLEAEHHMCEAKYNELRQESIADKVKIGILESKVNGLQQELDAVKKAQ
jgi:hypothetical protein